MWFSLSSGRVSQRGRGLFPPREIKSEDAHPNFISTFRKTFSNHQKNFANFQRLFASSRKGFAHCRKTFVAFQKTFATFRKLFAKCRRLFANSRKNLRQPSRNSRLKVGEQIPEKTSPIRTDLDRSDIGKNQYPRIFKSSFSSFCGGRRR